MTTASARTDMATALNRAAATLDELRARAKDAHWNVSGTANFYSLHKLFDDVATEANALTDVVAERVRQLRHPVNVKLAGASHLRETDVFFAGRREARAYVRALGVDARDTQHLLSAIATEASATGDEATNALLSDAAARISKLEWMLRSSMEPL